MNTPPANSLRIIYLEDKARDRDLVAETLAANDRGKVVLVPGWHNKLAVAILKLTPEFIAIPLLKRGSAKYHLEDS